MYTNQGGGAAHAITYNRLHKYSHKNHSAEFLQYVISRHISRLWIAARKPNIKSRAMKRGTKRSKNNKKVTNNCPRASAHFECEVVVSVWCIVWSYNKQVINSNKDTPAGTVTETLIGGWQEDAAGYSVPLPQRWRSPIAVSLYMRAWRCCCECVSVSSRPAFRLVGNRREYPVHSFRVVVATERPVIRVLKL